MKHSKFCKPIVLLNFCTGWATTKIPEMGCDGSVGVCWGGCFEGKGQWRGGQKEEGLVVCEKRVGWYVERGWVGMYVERG